MADSGFPSSCSDDVEASARRTYEPGGQMCIPSNDIEPNDAASDREARCITHESETQEVHQLREGDRESNIGVTKEASLSLQDPPSSTDQDGRQKRYPPHKSASDPGLQLQDSKRPKFHPSASFPPLGRRRDTQRQDALGLSDLPVSLTEHSSIEETYFDRSDANTVVKVPVQTNQHDGNLAWRGIPEGGDINWCPEETIQKQPYQPYQHTASDPSRKPQKNDCTESIGFLLDNAGASTEAKRKKQEILFKLKLTASPFPAKTILGLAESLLTRSQEEINHLCSQNHPNNPHRAEVHTVLMELETEGRCLADLVEYFWEEYSKRIDILKLVRDIHTNCPYCSNIFKHLK